MLGRLRLAGCASGDPDTFVFGNRGDWNGFSRSAIGGGAGSVLSLPRDSDVQNRNMRIPRQGVKEETKKSRRKGRSELLYQCDRQQLYVGLKTGEDYETGAKFATEVAQVRLT
jgi:hypothetical protein